LKVAISEAIYFVHMDADIFPNPQAYIPERWIEAQQNGIRLDRYLVAFTKGSRKCVGIK
jgi:cytochrome P450